MPHREAVVVLEELDAKEDAIRKKLREPWVTEGGV